MDYAKYLEKCKELNSLKDKLHEMATELQSQIKLKEQYKKYMLLQLNEIDELKARIKLMEAR